MLSQINKFFFILLCLSLPTSVALMKGFAWLVAIFGNINRKRFEFNRIPHLTFALGVVVTVILINLLINFDTEDSKKFIKSYRSDLSWIPIFLLFISSFSRISHNFLIKMLHVLFGASILISFYALVQRHVGFDYVRGTQIPSLGDYFQATGFFSHYQTFGYSSGLVAIFSLAFYLYEKSKLKYFYLGTFLFVTISVLCSYVRGAYLALILSICALTFMRNKKIFLKALVLGTFILGALVLFTPGLDERFGSILEGKSSGRFHIWSGYANIIKESPVFGIGPNKDTHLNLLQEAYDELNLTELSPHLGHAHNNYLQILVQYGALGLITFLGLFFLWIKDSISFVISSHKNKELPIIYSQLGLGALGAQIFLHVGGVFESNFIDSEVNLMFIFLLALFYSQYYNLKIKSSQN